MLLPFRSAFWVFNLTQSETNDLILNSGQSILAGWYFSLPYKQLIIAQFKPHNCNNGVKIGLNECVTDNIRINFSSSYIFEIRPWVNIWTHEIDCYQVLLDKDEIGYSIVL